MNFVDGVSLAVSVHQLVIPHDLLTFRVELFGRVKLISDFACKLNLVRNIDLASVHALSISVLLANVSNPDCERMNIGLEYLLQHSLKLTRVITLSDRLNPIANWFFKEVP